MPATRPHSGARKISRIAPARLEAPGLDVAFSMDGHVSRQGPWTPRWVRGASTDGNFEAWIGGGAPCPPGAWFSSLATTDLAARSRFGFLCVHGPRARVT